jgi:hypothetical protein
MLPKDWNQIFADVAEQHRDDDSLDELSELLSAVSGTAFESVFTDAQGQ